MCVTNREIRPGKKGLQQFGKNPNPMGPSELRFFEVDDVNVNKVKSLDDLLINDEVESLIKNYELPIDTSVKWYRSLKVACDIFKKAKR